MQASPQALEPQRIVIPMPLPIQSVNAWLFAARNGPSSLVDAGIGTAEGYEILRSALWDSGVDANGLQVVATHGHFDHVGNAARLRREFGAQLLAAEEEANLIERFHADAPQRYARWGAALTAHGVPPDRIAAMRQRGEAMDRWTGDVPVQRLVDGQVIQLGEARATVHVAPGHTHGSLLLELDSNDLVTGDTLLEHVTSNAIELADADRGRYANYLQTLDGMRRFAGMRALPGHGEGFRVTEELIDGHLAKHAARSRRVLARLDRPRTAWELLPLVFPRLAGDQDFLGVCEVVGHLHALVAEGKVAESEAAGVRRFVRAS